ncbi:hypothetical protein CUJ90_07145 [Paraburkholderia terricola]|nr:hypothetical protein CUJ90_07145 [Paraburkholderia terricola]
MDPDAHIGGRMQIQLHVLSSMTKFLAPSDRFARHSIGECPKVDCHSGGRQHRGSASHAISDAHLRLSDFTEVAQPTIVEGLQHYLWKYVRFGYAEQHADTFDDLQWA